MNPKPSNKPVKIPFDSLTLRAVVTELRAHLTGGQIQDVRQPEPSELYLGIRGQGRNYLLALSIDARFARVHLTSTRPPNAPTPPNFCMVLRKHIEDGKILALRQRDFDRIFEMEVETRDEAGEPTSCTLLAELMGKHSNLILVKADGTILDSAKRITHRINRLRETLPGLPYLPPPAQTDHADPFAPDALAPLIAQLTTQPDLTTDEIAERLLSMYTGMSPFLAREIALRAASVNTCEQGLREAWKATIGKAGSGEFSPVEIGVKGKLRGAYPYSTVQFPADQQQSVAELNFALDSAFAELRTQTDFEAAAAELKGRIEREVKRLERQKQSVEHALAEAERAEEHKQAGELILANLWQIQPGAPGITVQNYYDPALPDRTIPLSPTLSPQENAEAYFKRYRKARDGAERALEEETKIEAILQTLSQARARLQRLQENDAGNAREVRELQAELTTTGLLRALPDAAEEKERGRSGPDFEGHKIRRVTTPEGYEIYIGETATANDFLTTRLAAPNDLWLHVRAATSAHVLIRTHGQPSAVPNSVLQQAALLCARHSSQKHSSLVPVDYTLKKYVRKPRGAAPGSADYHHETTLHVTP